jgi:hypothetical protein
VCKKSMGQGEILLPPAEVVGPRVCAGPSTWSCVTGQAFGRNNRMGRKI